MDRFRIIYSSKNVIDWNPESRTLVIEDTGKVEFYIETISPTDTDAEDLIKNYKFDFFDAVNGSNYSFFKVDKKGNKIPGTTTDVYNGKRYTIKAKPGYKGDLFWVEFFDERSKFSESRNNLNTHVLGMFLKFDRPKPIIEKVEWLDPTTKKVVTEKSLGQYAILRIMAKNLEQETIRISLWEYDGDKKSIETKISGKPNHVYAHVGYKGGSGYTYSQISREDIDPKTGEKWKGTVASMDFGFSIDHDVMKEKLNKDGALDILVHLNPAWIQDRDGKDNMADNSGDKVWFSDLEIRVKIDHPRLPVYDDTLSTSGSKSGLYYGKLDVNKKVVTEAIPLEASKMVAAIVQNDSEMEAKGYEPCKFTYIKLSEGGRKSVLFKEAAMVATSLNDFKVLVGSKEKGTKTITIDLDDTDEKDPKKKLVVCKDVKGSDPNNPHKNNTFDTHNFDEKYVKTKKDNQLVLAVYAEIPDVPTALKNAWLPNIEPIPLKVLVQTCRYQRWVNIACYPDLQYEISFKSSSEADTLYEYKSKNFIKRDYKGSLGLFKKKKDKKKRKKQNSSALKEYKKEQKNKNLNDIFDYSGLQIGFEYSLGGIKQGEIAIDGEHPVFNAIDTFTYITSTIRKLCFDEEVEQAEKDHDPKKVKGRKKKRKDHLKKLKKTGKDLQRDIKKKSKKLGKKVDKLAPFSIAIKPPVFGGSVAWKLAPSTQKGLEHELGTEFSINFKADPLIEIEGRLDLLFVATKIPYIGQAVMGLQKVADGAGVADDVWNWFVDLFNGDEKYKIDIDIDYHLDLIVSAAYKPTWTAGKYHTIDGFEWGDLSAITEFQFGIEAMLKLNIKVGDFKGEAFIGGSAKAKWVVQKAKSKDTGEEVWQIDYQGLYVVFAANISAKNKDDVKNPKKEEPKSGDRFLIQGPLTFEIKI